MSVKIELFRRQDHPNDFAIAVGCGGGMVWEGVPRLLLERCAMFRKVFMSVHCLWGMVQGPVEGPHVGTCTHCIEFTCLQHCFSAYMRQSIVDYYGMIVSGVWRRRSIC